MGETMQKKQHSKLSTWTLWSPLKFATISLGLMLISAFIFILISNATYGPNFIPRTPLLIITLCILVGTIAMQIYQLPRTTMDRQSFILTHNIQTLILSILFLGSSYLIVRYAQQIIFNLLIMETQTSSIFIITLLVSALFYLYLTGLLIANIYAKFRRIRAINIPTWKIIFSMPFGFSALWTPGYILDYADTKSTTIQPKSKTLTSVNNWISTTTTNTIAAFIFITLASGFVFGLNSVLLTFALTLIFGIWALQIGTKKFIKNMSGKYATYAVIFNIALTGIILAFHIFVPTTTQNVQIHISDTEITLPQQQ